MKERAFIALGWSKITELLLQASLTAALVISTWRVDQDFTLSGELKFLVGWVLVH